MNKEIWMLKNTGRIFLMYKGLFANGLYLIMEREDGVLFMDPTGQYFESNLFVLVGYL